MRLMVLAVGQKMPDWVERGWSEYARRMPADCSLILREIKAEPRNTGKAPLQMMKAEAERLRAAIPAGALTVALDERGTDLDSEGLSRRLADWRAQAREVVIVIGGPDGLDPEFKTACSQRLRLSSLTLPHPLVRVLLAEQLYRAWSILTGHPYHRA
jgi:23S rRNA (pseudouridine1915-N3)-methyltransferase